MGSANKPARKERAQQETKEMKHLYMVAGLALAAPVALPMSAANAVGVTITSSPGTSSPLGAGEQIVCDFDSSCLDKVTGNYGFRSGTTSNWAAPGGNNTTDFLVIPGTGAGGTALLDFSWLGPIKSFSFDWGSIDTYNSVLVSLANGFNFTVTGSDIINSGFGNQTSTNANRRVYFNFDSSVGVNSVRLTSTSIAFEADNFAAAVPEPASWAMLIAGFGIVGATMRRRRMVSVTA